MQTKLPHLAKPLIRAALALLLLSSPTLAPAETSPVRPPSLPDVDAPELAAPGAAAAGMTQRIFAIHDRLDPLAAMMHEISSISKNRGALVGHAKDPITTGLSAPCGAWTCACGIRPARCPAPCRSTTTPA